MRNRSVVVGLALFLLMPMVGICADKGGIWGLMRGTIDETMPPTYEEVRQQLPLLVDKKDIDDQGDAIVIAGGYIVLTKKGLSSYANKDDYKAQAKPEYSFNFATDPWQRTNYSKSVTLKGIRIMLDIIPTHQYFESGVGTWTYKYFVGELQRALAQSLEAADATISYLRPERESKPEIYDNINKNPPHIFISTQFNNDKQDGMTTFCSGNILAKELVHERQRARFMHAAYTGKCLHSVRLGACVSMCCKENLNVSMLDWKKASFEGTTRAVSASTLLEYTTLDKDDQNYSGVATRNLAQNNIFCKYVIIPFPDMQWVQKQVANGREQEWIDSYAAAIQKALVRFVNQHQAEF